MVKSLNLITWCLSLVLLLLFSCNKKEENVNHLILEYLKEHNISATKYDVNTSVMNPAKCIAINDSATWSLVSQWITCIQLIDAQTQQKFADESMQENLLTTGFILANEYVDSINYRINQLDSTKTLGYEFIQSGSISLDNDENQDVKFRIITDSDVSKILLLTPMGEESERIIKIIEEAQRGNLTKLPVDPQREMMYYLSTGKSKPSF